MRPIALAFTLALEFSTAAWLAACGSSSSGAPAPSPDGGASKDSAIVKDAVPDVIVDPKNCVAPGTPEYCSPMGGQCDMAGPGGSSLICTADLTGTPAHAWYCTTPCDKPTQCTGSTACKSTPMGSRCVPKSCDSLLPEGGPDDSGSDGETEAASEAGLEGGPKDSAADAPKDGAHDAPSLDATD